MIKLLTFTDQNMTISAAKCLESGMRHGADGGKIWTPANLSAEFKETMADGLKQAFGAGYYCWKPYIVHREMCKLKDGDILVYCDAGNEWISDMRQAINCMDQDILFFSNGWKHVEWCKWDCIDAILRDYITPYKSIEYDQERFFPGDTDNKTGITKVTLNTGGSWPFGELLNAEQVQASTFFIRVTPDTRRFIQEWYAWSIVPGMIDNEPSKLPNVPTFREHRWDQSILCCLQIKYGYKLHWFPTTTAGYLKHLYPNDKYPILLNHHRKRNDEWKT